MFAQIIILKDLWKRMTDVDNPKVTLALGLLLILIAPLLSGFLLLYAHIFNFNSLFNLNYLKIIDIMLFIEMNFLGICMLFETLRLKHIAKDKGFWFWWLNTTYINEMSYSDLEECIAWIYSMHGYVCKVLRKHSHEHGADIIAEKGNETIAIQVKRWKNKVGKESVDQVLKSINYYHPTQLYVNTNNLFTKPTHKYAKEKGVRLIESNELLSLYKEAQEIYGKTIHRTKRNHRI